MDIKGILHTKRATTEEHIKILQQEGREGRNPLYCDDAGYSGCNHLDDHRRFS